MMLSSKPAPGAGTPAGKADFVDVGGEVQRITQNTAVPLGVVATLGSAAIICLLWLIGQFNTINNHLSSIDQALHGLWSAQDMQVWSLKLERNNPSLKIPDSVDVQKESRR